MRKIAFVWDNFGPMHDDRVNAVANSFGADQVVGIEIFGRSDTYEWNNNRDTKFRKFTIFDNRINRNITFLRLFFLIVYRCYILKVDDVFFCNYERGYIFASAFVLRLLRRRCYMMSCSKFDDYQRSLGREYIKRLLFIPYSGVISSGVRARDYMRMMGFGAGQIATEYNTLAIERIRNLSGQAVAPDGRLFAERHFTIVARFVPKKNIKLALQAFSQYISSNGSPRQLHLCGSGELEAELRKTALELGIADKVIFRGFLQTQDVAKVLSDTLALILPSVEEQFGNAVIEAQAMGVPVILSDKCGARDNLIRNGVNGFVIEPDNAEGLAFFMNLIGSNEELWRTMCTSAAAFADKGDVARFAEAVETLVC